jgi:hypothetical protein
MEKIYVTLYKMNNCIWCIKFQPVWDLIVSTFNTTEVKNKFKKSNMELDFLNLEHNKDYEIIKKAGIRSYPTIKVTIEKDGKKDNFTLEDNQREVSAFIKAILKNSSSDLIDFVTKKVNDAQAELNNKQTGGYFQYANTKRMRYYNEYLRLRKEYLLLKNKK